MSVVYYSQKDSRWASMPYTKRNDPKQTIATSACGPTSFAMIAATWRDKSIQPPETARFALNNGYRTDNSGTDWAYFTAAAKYYGLACKQSGSHEEVKRALSEGALVVASMGPGHLTGGGHYVLMVGINGKWIDVHDPNHTYRYPNDGLVDRGKGDGRIKVDEVVFKREAKQYWIFAQPIKEDEPMNAEERKSFATLEKRVGELEMSLEKATAQNAPVAAPTWFVEEFAQDGVLEQIKGDGKSKVVKPLVFWETLAVSLRTQGFGRGVE